MIEFMYTENEHDVVVAKIIRLGARHKEYQQNPRPARGQKNCKNKKTIKSIPNLKCFYTNCDTLTNKMDELLFHININNPDILVLTEVAPKKQQVFVKEI